MEKKGSLINKNVYVYDPHIKCSMSEFINDIRKYTILSLLRQISDLLTALFHRGSRKIFLFHTMPINDDFLLYAALHIIKNGDNNGIDIDRKNMFILLNKARALYDEEVVKELNSTNEILLRLAYRDFLYQEKLLNSIARTVIIYSKLWDKYSTLKSDKLFSDVFGLSCGELLTHFLIILSEKNSFFYRLHEESIVELNKHLKVKISKYSEEKFLAWICCSSEKIVEYQGSLDNPLEKYPIYSSNIIPPGQKESVYLKLSKNALYFKLTYFLYYDFIEYFNEGSGKNTFKENYGIVFQEYVGFLLFHYFKKWKVIPEIKYKKGHDTVASVDWIVEKKGKVILVEIKQSSVFLTTKQTGSIESYRIDIKKTIQKAKEQLDRTETDIVSRMYKELAPLNQSYSFEKICVLGDPLFFGNYISYSEIKDISDIHLINISDFEDLLALQKKKEGLFYVLKQKKEKAGTLIMDFKEYLILKYKNKYKKLRVDLLDSEYLDFMNNILGLEPHLKNKN